jgi:hypothetical protein
MVSLAVRVSHREAINRKSGHLPRRGCEAREQPASSARMKAQLLGLTVKLALVAVHVLAGA